MGNTETADREEADTWTPVSHHVCQGTSAGVGKASPEPPESVRPAVPGRQLGKTFYMPVRGGEVVADAALAVGKHPLPNSPCREWFALFTLCRVLNESYRP